MRVRQRQKKPARALQKIPVNVGDNMSATRVALDSGKVKNLILVRVKDDVSDHVRSTSHARLQKVLGDENVVIVLPEDMEIEVISLSADEAGSEGVVVGNPTAKWNF